MGEGTPGACLCWLCCFLPMLGGPWKVHLPTHLECVGRRVHHDATYITGGADHVGPAQKWLAAVCCYRGHPSPVVVVGCRVRLLGGGFLALVVFSLLSFLWSR